YLNQLMLHVQAVFPGKEPGLQNISPGQGAYGAIAPHGIGVPAQTLYLAHEDELFTVIIVECAHKAAAVTMFLNNYFIIGIQQVYIYQLVLGLYSKSMAISFALVHGQGVSAAIGGKTYPVLDTV